METNNKASTSHDQSDSSDDNDEHHKKLSTEQLSLKIKTCRNLCFGNKINVSNAFDIDMIECFYSWLEKKKSSIFADDNDVTSFQEISDYLEATAKVYSYRVDNLSETTSKLVEQFKAINYDNDDNNDDDNAPKIQKSKRQKIMLTTNEKLRRRPNEYENIFNTDLIDHSISNFNSNELFFTHCPSRYFSSLYYGKSFAEEMKTFEDEKKEYDEKKENDETIEIEKDLCDMMDEFLKGSLCPEFDGFIAERDKVDNSNDVQLNGIEYRFDPDNHQFLEDNNSEDSIASNKSENNKLDSNLNDKNTTVLDGLDGLLECIDNVDRDYSFFNPKLLANWNGPKAWKAQAMSKALKSSTPSERKDIISNIDQNIDESTQNNIGHSETLKKRNKVKKKGVKLNWLDESEIIEILKNNVQGKEKILPRTLRKWDPLDNITNTQEIVADVKYESNFAQYIQIVPDWCSYKKNQENDTWSKNSNSSQNIDDCDNSFTEIPETIKFDNINNEHLDNRSDEVYDKLGKLDASGELNPEGEDALVEIKTESKIDIAVLKTEISDIIDKECVETDPNSEWSSKLSFLNLLINLRINDRDELSIPLVFVGLLHLANERGLKLFQEHCTINDMEETFIAKPIKKK